MLLSVIMPVHKARATVHSSVRSTLIAMPKASELILLVEGADAIEYDFESIRDSRLKVFRRDSAVGISSALNFLLEKAQGELVARMDADDICLPWRFHHQIRKINRYQSDFLFSNAILFGRQVKPLGFIPQPPISLSVDESKIALALANPFVHPTMLARRRTLLEMNGYSSSVAEDHELWLRSALSEKTFARSAAWVVLYRIHKGQLTQQAMIQQRIKTDDLLQSADSKYKAKIMKNLGISLQSGDFDSNLWKVLEESNFWIRVLRGPGRTFLESIKGFALKR